MCASQGLVQRLGTVSINDSKIKPEIHQMQSVSSSGLVEFGQ
jgi:hypothetical protein